MDRALRVQEGVRGLPEEPGALEKAAAFAGWRRPEATTLKAQRFELQNERKRRTQEKQALANELTSLVRKLQTAKGDEVDAINKRIQEITARAAELGYNPVSSVETAGKRKAVITPAKELNK